VGVFCVNKVGSIAGTVFDGLWPGNLEVIEEQDQSGFSLPVHASALLEFDHNLMLVY
jgi:hypothetical protein